MWAILSITWHYFLNLMRPTVMSVYFENTTQLRTPGYLTEAQKFLNDMKNAIIQPIEA